jgi:hypothetical protein
MWEVSQAPEELLASQECFLSMELVMGCLSLKCIQLVMLVLMTGINNKMMIRHIF